MLILDYNFPRCFVEIRLNGLPALNKAYEGIGAGSTPVNEFLVTGKNNIEVLAFPYIDVDDLSNADLAPTSFDKEISLNLRERGVETPLAAVELTKEDYIYRNDYRAFYWQGVFQWSKTDITPFLNKLDFIRDNNQIIEFANFYLHSIKFANSSVLTKLLDLKASIIELSYSENKDKYIKNYFRIWNNKIVARGGLYYENYNIDQILILDYLNSHYKALYAKRPETDRIAEAIPSLAPHLLPKEKGVISKKSKINTYYKDSINVIFTNGEYKLFI
ncbi:hypothetical protein [Spartinivicinus ruber]|uniref:hypothetical protein n=1 Tax=Spartinivicinus ruber TaxID=2683272 RepID=UPI0013D2B3BD|nr:hypothetical protein [Spartinivicinus ruber]